jgi:hypothetical protein
MTVERLAATSGVQNGAHLKIILIDRRRFAVVNTHRVDAAIEIRGVWIFSNSKERAVCIARQIERRGAFSLSDTICTGDATHASRSANMERFHFANRY